MRKRTARRLALRRHHRWLLRSHPDAVAPRCLLRAVERSRQAWIRRTVEQILREGAAELPAQWTEPA